MKKKIVALVMIGVSLILTLGGCGTQETSGGAESTQEKQTENKKRKDDGEVLTLETKSAQYDSDSGELEYSVETEYDALGNKVWEKEVSWSSGAPATVAYGPDGKEIETEQNYGVQYEDEYTYEYEYDGNDIKSCIVRCGEESMRYEREYDKKGNLTKEFYYDGSSGNFLYGNKYQYNSRGDMILEEYFCETEDKRISWTENEYDDKGNQLKCIKYVAPESYGLPAEDDAFITGAQEWEYDGSGNLIKELQYGGRPDGTRKINYWREYEYDAANNQIKEKMFEENGFMYEWNYTEYDENGYIRKKTLYESDDSVQCWDEYVCDAYGNITKWTGYNSDGSVFSSRQYRYDYDALGNKTQYIEYYSDGGVADREEWRYDESGNLAEYTRYDGEVMVEQVEYVTIVVK